MGLERVRSFLSKNAPDLQIVQSSSNPALASGTGWADGFPPAPFAKSSLINAGHRRVLIVMLAADRIDRQKFKSNFGAQPKFLAGAVVEMVTGHQVEGVSPFGLASRIPVFCDMALSDLRLISISAGESGYRVILTPPRLARLMSAAWVEVAKISRTEPNAIPSRRLLEMALA
jgi:prolyl-tRNA editing enzyme YbaK/EbsC (Cys-tRNA(Pro) deacylase)